ncbi:MAG: hypothetical protein Q4C77_04115 [Eubacteriales bacterium]|nr:hypothetical protein [Eubacteriales bacterium]
MATKLKNLKVTKVDFVDQGANPDAHIKLFKRKDEAAGKGYETAETEENGVLKRLLSAIAKMAGLKPEEINSAVEEIEKGGSETFAEKMNQRKNQKIVDEMWDICYALHSSLCSIAWDEELDSTGASNAMLESLEDFCTMMKESIGQWSSGKAVGITKNTEEVTAEELEIMKSVYSRLAETIEKADPGPAASEPVKKENMKGEDEMSKIDKSKLTNAERLFLEDLEKRYGIDKSASGEETKEEAKETVKEGKEGKEDDAVKKALQTLGLSTSPQTADGQEDIYKGLHPAVKAEIEALRKFREQTEEKELREVAKSYEIIGKKEDELYPVLKSVKAAGGDAYNQLIAALDDAKSAVEKSGAFAEIGKSGYRPTPSYPANENSAEAKISSIAKGYIEKDPGMSYTDAVAKAWEDNPELMAAYEEEARF